MYRMCIPDVKRIQPSLYVNGTRVYRLSAEFYLHSCKSLVEYRLHSRYVVHMWQLYSCNLYKSIYLEANSRGWGRTNAYPPIPCSSHMHPTLHTSCVTLPFTLTLHAHPVGCLLVTGTPPPVRYRTPAAWYSPSVLSRSPTTVAGATYCNHFCIRLKNRHVRGWSLHCVTTVCCASSV